ncbi:MAG: restriction endonuclease subunit S [Burkholderiales bacterium]|nr:restriction endonuclease subunit S [Burkholderiales bacterium]
MDTKNNILDNESTQLPAGWVVKKLGDVVDCFDKLRSPLSSIQRAKIHGIYPYYGAQGIIDYIDDYIFDGQYILIAEDGENLRSRKQPIANIAKGRFWVNNHAHVLRNNKNSNFGFIYYYLNFVNLSAFITGAVQPKLNQENLFKIPFLCPSIKEQKEIATILSSLDDKIELNQQINKKLEEMAQAIFKEWFIDSDYKKFPISKFIDFNPSYKLSRSNEVAYLEMANVDTNSYRAVNWSYRKSGAGAKFKNGDTLFARITPCLENGKTCFVDFLADDEVAYGSTEYIVMRSKDQFHPFLSYLIAKNKDFRNYAINTMTGTSGRQRAQADKLAHFEIRLPANEIITEINNQFESITSKLKNTSEQIDFLINIRDTLLPKLISGDVNIFVGNYL